MGSKSLRVTLAAVLCCWAWSCSPQPQKEPPLTPAGKDYARTSLQLSEVGMKAADSYARQTLTEIVGKIKNAGGRAVNRVDVYCMFYDRRGVLVLKERTGIVKRTLKPGETRNFRLAFDDIPDGWDNQLPKLVIAQVIFD